MKHLASLAVTSLALISTGLAGPIESISGKAAKTGQPVAAYDPLEHWEIGFETASLWSFGGNATPLNYVFLPQMITVKTRPRLLI